MKVASQILIFKKYIKKSGEILLFPFPPPLSYFMGWKKKKKKKKPLCVKFTYFSRAGKSLKGTHTHTIYSRLYVYVAGLYATSDPPLISLPGFFISSFLPPPI